jgi:hypothetical protein
LEKEGVMTAREWRLAVAQAAAIKREIAEERASEKDPRRKQRLEEREFNAKLCLHAFAEREAYANARELVDLTTPPGSFEPAKCRQMAGETIPVFGALMGRR